MKEWEVNATDRTASTFHTLQINLEASEVDIYFSREILLRWTWGIATTLDWHRVGESR